jgi:transcriptional regulator with XRE-family HTH domain
VTLGERIKGRRARLGLSQEELARLVAIRRPTITELETNKRTSVSSDILKKLAQALGVTTDYLVGAYEDADEHAPARLVAIGRS